MSLKWFTRGHTPDSQTFRFKVWLCFASGRPGWRPVVSLRDFTLRPIDIDTLLSPMTTSRHGKRSTSFRRQPPANEREFPFPGLNDEAGCAGRWYNNTDPTEGNEGWG